MIKTISFIAMIALGAVMIAAALNLFILHWTPPGVSMTDREFFITYMNECITTTLLMLGTGLAYSIWSSRE